jgi:CHASE1-domain containing sensor protein
MRSVSTFATQTRLGRLSLPGTVAVGLSLTLAVTWLAHRRETFLQEREFAQRTGDATAALVNAFSVPAEVALALPAFIATHPELDAPTFARFTQPTARRHPSIAALEWMPLVEHATRPDYEATSGTPIIEPDARGNMIRAQQRERYFPIRFMTPEVPGVLGLDVGFEPLRQRLLVEAMNSEGTFLTERFRLVEDPEGVFSIALYAPVRRSVDGPDKGFDNLRGLTVSLFRLRPVVEDALSSIDLTGIRYVLEDETAEPEARLLYAGGDNAVGNDAKLQASKNWQYLNRVWRISWYGDVGRIAQRQTSLLVFVAGMLLTGAAFAVVYTLRRLRRLAKQFDTTRPLGNYTLLKKLGEGGMGSVYLARHALLRRPTAVKIIRAHLTANASKQEEAQARFEREVQWTSQLTHPNTIAVFDYGRSEDGHFYYAMEYLHGLSLETVVKHGGPLPERRAVHLMKQVTSALAEAHGLGLVHRDIKPDNIMLCNRGGVADFVKVLDFGLAKSFAADAKLSQAGGLVGTPGYIAPETLLSGESDTRSDVYSLGALLYYLLSGRPAFSGETPMAVISKALAGPPDLSSELFAHVHAGLRELTECCMGEASNRPENAKVLLAKLDALPMEPWLQEEAIDWWNTVGKDLLAKRDAEAPSSGSGSTLFVDITASGRFR